MIYSKQKELDQQRQGERQLAINYYQISAVDTTHTFSLIPSIAKNHVHLTTKYLAELTIHELHVTPLYGVRI